MRRILLLIMIVLFSTPAWAQPDDFTDLKTPIDQVLQKAREKFNVPGLALSILLPGETKPLDFYSGTTEVKGKEALNGNNLFQVASITKSFTAAIILQLEAEGKLSLQDKVGKWLPQYPKWSDITVLQLLNQTSGIPDYINGEHFWDLLAENPKKVWSADQMLSMAYGQRMLYEPGKGWNYSNSNYTLLGMIIEKTTNQSLQTEIQNRFLAKDKLALDNTFYMPYNPPQAIMDRMAHGYNLGTDVTNQNVSWLQGAGAIISNPSDLALWGRALFTGSVLGDKQKQQLMQWVSTWDGTPLNYSMEEGYGLGVFKVDSPYGIIWLVPGLSEGYRSALVYLPCKNIFFAFTASSSVIESQGFHIYLITQIVKVLYQSPAVDKTVTNYFSKDALPTFCHNYVPPRYFNFSTRGTFNIPKKASSS